MPHHNRPPPAVRLVVVMMVIISITGMIEVVSKSVNLVIPHAIHRALGPLPVYLAYAYMIHDIGNSSTGPRRSSNNLLLLQRLTNPANMVI